MDEYLMLYSHNGILYNNEKELCTTIHINMVESHSHTIEQKKPDVKRICIYYDSIYIEYLKRKDNDFPFRSSDWKRP